METLNSIRDTVSCRAVCVCAEPGRGGLWCVVGCVWKLCVMGLLRGEYKLCVGVAEVHLAVCIAIGVL